MVLLDRSPPFSPAPLDDPQVVAYLRRLGVEAEPPSVDALVRLHRAQVERVPYETFWIHLGQDWGIDPHESLARFVRQRRGGYCFHLNGTLAVVLQALGYEVTVHSAGVHAATGRARGDLGNHAALVVASLPSEENPHGCWYVDAGLGDVLHEPVALTPCARLQPPIALTMSDATDGIGRWRLTAVSAPAVTKVSMEAAPTALTRFQARHDHNRRSRDSTFARTVTAQRRHASGSDVLRGLVLTRIATGSSTTATFERRREWLAALDDIFGIRLDVSVERIEMLWQTVGQSHDRWLARPDVEAA